MPSSPFVAQLAQFRTLLAAARPWVDDTTRFTPHAGDMSIEEAENTTPRLFSVIGAPGGTPDPDFGEFDYRKEKRTALVKLKYDPKLDQEHFEEMIASDAAQIVGLFELMDSRVTPEVEIVTFTGDTRTESGRYALITLSFQVTYLVATGQAATP